jgi:hypothetical protein
VRVRGGSLKLRGTLAPETANARRAVTSTERRPNGGNEPTAIWFAGVVTRIRQTCGSNDEAGKQRHETAVQEIQMKLLTTTAVAEMLSVPDGTLRYWRKVGLGPSWVKLEGSIRYTEDDVLRYIERNRRTPSVRAYMEEKNAV